MILLANSLSRPQLKFIVSVLFLISFLYYMPQSLPNAYQPAFMKNYESLHQAKTLLPDHLMAMSLPNVPGHVPRLFHQSWSSTVLPGKMKAWSRGCREVHPDWHHVLWTDEDNLMLITKHFRWLLPTYLTLKSPILQADFMRNAYMYLYGGVYADLDTECLRNFAGIFQEHDLPTIHYDHAFSDPRREPENNNTRKAFFGRLGTENNFKHSIPNAWMASEPGHPFFLFMLMWVRDKLRKGMPEDMMIEDVTGPGALFFGLQTFENPEFHGSVLEKKFSGENLDVLKLYRLRPSLPAGDETVILPFWYIFPYSHSRDGDAFREFCWVNKAGFNATRCKDIVGVDRWPSYSITYWSHTWTDDGHQGGLESVQED